MAGERPVSSGDRINFSADFHNKQIRSLQQGGRTGDRPLVEPRRFDWVYCKNSTADSTNFGRFDPVSIEGTLFTVSNATMDGSEEYFADSPVLQAYKPDWRKGNLWGLTLEPIPAGYVGRVLISGICPVKLVGHRHINVAGPNVTAGTLGTLKTGLGDCQVLWQDLGSDVTDESEHWGLVHLGGPQIEIEGKITTAGLAPDDGQTDPETCVMKPWRYVDSQSQSVSKRQMETINKEITVVNRDPSLIPVLNSYARIRWVNQEWRLVWIGC